ncbi:unnamed protein product, partial [Ectocarpus fasciculatus]
RVGEASSHRSYRPFERENAWATAHKRTVESGRRPLRGNAIYTAEERDSDNSRARSKAKAGPSEVRPVPCVRCCCCCCPLNMGEHQPTCCQLE